MKSDKDTLLSRLGLLVNRDPNNLHTDIRTFCDGRLNADSNKEQIESLVEILATYSILVHADLILGSIQLDRIHELKNMFDSAKVELPEKIEQLMRIKKEISVKSKILSMEPVITLSEQELAVLNASTFVLEVLVD